MLDLLHCSGIYLLRYSGFLQQKGVKKTTLTDFSIKALLEKQLDEQLDEQLEQLERHGEHESEENSSILVHEMTQGSENSMDETLSQQLAKIDSTGFDTGCNVVEFDDSANHREYDASDRDHELEGKNKYLEIYLGIYRCF